MRKKTIKIPKWLKYRKGVNEKSPVWFLDLRGTGFSPDSPDWQVKVNIVIESVLKDMDLPQWKEPVLIKCHIGEKKCRTRMLPEFCLSTVKHLRSSGIRKIVSGDTSVAYSGDRGYHDNKEDCTRYLSLADRHGWTETGPLKTPFVVIDRPQTSVDGVFSFSSESVKLIPGDACRFREVFLSGGFAAAEGIVNHVHLTLHDMAQVACAVKGLTMGGSSYKGKLIMHKCYSPVIDAKKCKKCGSCATNCPESAFTWQKGEVPNLEKDRCIGCGECLAVCHGKSISMETAAVEDWLRGGDSLPYRMADYIMGMAEDRWDKILNVVHLYNITRRCDCVDRAQKPLIPHIGFLIGRNPFAVDLMSTYLLHEEFHKQVKNGSIKGGKSLGKSEILKIFFAEYHGMAPYMYIQKKYGITVEPEPIRITI
ncbi:MAG: DUF362 domain-containing protein [Nitrospirota bacterium]|nr:DUF362 domain-containing protein [Nitrospirota bacterium]